MNKENDNRKIRLRYGLAVNVAIISGALLLILSTLMVTNNIQTQSVDPLNSEALNSLMIRLQQNQSDVELQSQIRALDLLARKAYFTNKWQIKVGSYLLFTFVLVLLVSLKSLSSLKMQFPDLTQKLTTETTWQDKLVSRKYFAYGGLALFFLALFAGIFTETETQANSERVHGKPKQAVPEHAPVNLDDIRSNWPGFRGPEGLGIVYGNEKAPLEWDGHSGKNIIWKTPIPLSGFNSPVIWDGKIFFSGADDEHLSVFCMDVADGKILWEHELNDIPGSPDPRPKVMDYTGYAAPTMAVDGQSVFVMFGTGDIACMDFSGNRIWAKNLGAPANHYGHSSSLISYGKTLIVQFDQNKQSNLIGLNTETGEQVYNTVRDTKISWASPILINSGNRMEVVLSSNPSVIAYEPSTGKELWRLECMSGEVGPSPAFADGLVYACNDYAKLAAFKPGITSAIIWETDEDLSEVASPVANKEIVVMAASFGTASLFDSKTGERAWYYDADEGFYSSPIIVHDKIYLMDVSGMMHIIKADKTFELIRTNSLGEKASTIPAFYQNRIFIRGENNMYCIGDHD